MSEFGSGYASLAYAESFGAQVNALNESHAFLLQRPIPNTDLVDASGCYPFCSAPDWPALLSELRRVESPWVSLALVTDPFAEVSESQLRAVFSDRCFLYKQHHVCDLTQPLDAIVHPHHRRNARKALGALQVVFDDAPSQRAADWIRLYDTLRDHHRISGPADFTPEQLRAQLRVPGATMLRAVDDGATVAAIVIYRHGEHAYYHLGASSERGYALRATFALFWSALQRLAEEGVRWFSLGASAGVHAGGADGLDRFKAGWCNATRPVYFCGRVYDRAQYDRLTTSTGTSATNFFPAYRVAQSPERSVGS